MQVWMNIISNASNVAQKRCIEHPKMVITLSDTSIHFHDNCQGIDLQIIENMRKNIYSGIGLKMCHDIVEKYGNKTLNSK